MWPERMEEAFHVVCHECSEEGVYESRSDAVATREAHADGTSHRVSLLAIGPAVPNP
ncbi:hypothetical protein Hmuk_1401 [Halomicrobium mukohataei DSM 12286]|uniref:DUF1059 domain-containing protein n=2 Tax=Haloarculaceae TaxID=1963268 RepID=C7P350_HALMD|nr:hypothetical protein Hmuk_1401 [Halomicrobium mukohataei DSM 12286]